MAFVKERIPEADKDLFNSFEAYDYDNGRIHTWALAGGSRSKWVVNREREIYFFYVYGGHHLEQHPYKQYDLVWKGKKVVVFLEKWGNYDPNPKSDGLLCSHYTYDIVRIYAPKEFEPLQKEMINLIEEVITVDHSISISNSGVHYNKSTMKIKSISIPEYFDEVK